MTDFKVRCISDDGSGAFTRGEIYQVVGGCMLDIDGNVRGNGFYSADDINHRFSSQFELVEENKVFTKDDLKVGYVLELNNDRNDLVMVLPYHDGSGDGLCVCGKNMWFPVNGFDNDLIHNGETVTKVYGTTCPMNAYKIESDGRELIWQRQDEREISVEEATRLITEKYGQNVRIRVGK